MRRVFSPTQRFKLFVGAKGRCIDCNIELSDEWEAHHTIPFSEGGSTEITNGEALCLECHRRRHREMNEGLKYGNFYKDYSWQELAIKAFMDSVAVFYSNQPGQFERAFVIEVSPSGGKSTFSLKLVHDMIVEGLIDKALWVVPRDNIKDGFADDIRHLDKLPREKRLLGDQRLRIDTSLESNYNGMLRNYHGAIINYQSLPQMLDYLRLLSNACRLLIILDEVHHGRNEEDESDEVQSVWGEAMTECRSLACAIVCMTGTAIRSDNKRIPYFRYEKVMELDKLLGWSVLADFKFTYSDAIVAGIARKILCRSQDPRITYQMGSTEKGEAKEITLPVSSIPIRDLQSIKNTVFYIDRGIVDDMLRIAYEESEVMRKLDDPDAAILVIVRRDTTTKSNNLSDIKRRILDLFDERAITVQSSDKDARSSIKAFKKGIERWIVAKEMITEGSNLPRIRIIVILRDIGNPTFYNQLVHRATRNDAEDRPQDAIIIQIKFPHLHEWGSDLEEQALIAVENREAKQKSRNKDGDKERISTAFIQGLFAESDSESVLIEGEDFTDVDPIGRIIHSKIGGIARVSRWQIDMMLREGTIQGSINLSSTAINQPVFTIDEQVTRFLDMGKADCRKAAQNLGGNDKDYASITNEAKRSAGIKCPLGDVMRDHPNPLEAAKRFAEAARRAVQRTNAMRRENKI